MSETNRRTRSLSSFAAALERSGRSSGTVEGYLRDVGDFLARVRGNLTKASVLKWRDSLTQRGLAPSTINRKVAAVNSYLRFIGRDDCRVPSLKVQRRTFREPSRELTRREYTRLIRSARGTERLILETIAATGIRVSELCYITVEAAREGRAYIRLKGKTRTILLPTALRKKLLRHAGELKSGPIFRRKDGKPVDRRQVWKMMKAIAEMAGVEKSKVFPHNLRHLFARVFYERTKDVAKLADILGHSNVNTTRLYLVSTGEEHLKLLDGLGLLT